MFISRVNRSRQDYWVFLDQNARATVIDKDFNNSSSSSVSSSSTSSESSSSVSSSSISSESSSSVSSSSSDSSESAEDNSSSSSSFGYCNTEIGAEKFSIADYNGVYTVAGEKNSRPYWTNENGKFLYYTTGGNFWCMAGSLGGLTIYRNSIDGILCPYGSGCANYETWPGGGAAGIICSGEVSSSSSSSSSSSESSESGADPSDSSESTGCSTVTFTYNPAGSVVSSADLVSNEASTTACNVWIDAQPNIPAPGNLSVNAYKDDGYSTLVGTGFVETPSYPQTVTISSQPGYLCDGTVVVQDDS